MGWLVVLVCWLLVVLALHQDLAKLVDELAWLSGWLWLGLIELGWGGFVFVCVSVGLLSVFACSRLMCPSVVC